MASLRRVLTKTLPSMPQLVFHTSENNLLSDRKRPAALILGFGGAKPAHIEKYAQLYHAEGLGAISYTSTDFWDNVPDPSEGIPFAPIFVDPLHRKRPLIIHTMSMNGFRSLIRLYRWLDFQGETTERLKGIVFDSTPCMLSSEMLAYGKAVCEDDTTSTLYRPQAFWTCAKYFVLKHMDPDTLDKQQMYHYVSRWIILPRNQLYIYSVEDIIVSDQHVEGFALQQKIKGNSIQMEKFEGSQHVGHIRSNPSRYKKAAPCGHNVCEECCRNVARTAEPDVPYCPLCRAPVPADPNEWDLKSEMLEKAMLEKDENRKNIPPQNFLECTDCHTEKPFNDFAICLQCSPKVQDYLEKDELAACFKRAVCCDCNQKHYKMHMKKDHQVPVDIPVHILTTSDPHFLALTLLGVIKRFPTTDHWYESAIRVAKLLLSHFLRRHPNMPRMGDGFDLLREENDLCELIDAV